MVGVIVRQIEIVAPAKQSLTGEDAQVASEADYAHGGEEAQDADTVIGKSLEKETRLVLAAVIRNGEVERTDRHMIKHCEDRLPGEF